MRTNHFVYTFEIKYLPLNRSGVRVGKKIRQAWGVTSYCPDCGLRNQAGFYMRCVVCSLRKKESEASLSPSGPRPFGSLSNSFIHIMRGNLRG